MKKGKLEAKKKMLKELKKMMRDDYYEPMKGDIKKVTVMSDSEEGLKEGLSKAEEIMKMKGLEKDEEREEEYEEDESEEYASGGCKKKKK
jgi:hypothetical protein